MVLEDFLMLLKDARLGQSSQQKDYDYESLYQASIQHEVTALLYHQIYRFSNIPLDLKQKWKRKAVQINAIQTIRSDAFLRVYKDFIKEGVKVIVLKGIVVRALYPQPENRPSNDEDLYIEKQNAEKAIEIMIKHGFQILQKTEEVTVLVNVNNGLSIELHTTLFSKESKAYGSYQNFFHDAFENAQTHQINGQDVYSLSYDQHMLFLIMHFVKHFLHGGVGFRQLLDIIMYAETYAMQIEWKKIYDVLREEHLLILLENLFSIAQQYLGFSLENISMPIDYEQTWIDADDLLTDIWEAGIFGKSTQERVHSSTITLSAAGGRQSLRMTLFPSLKSLKDKYAYLQKMPFLLPLAWCTRILHFLFDKGEGSAKGAMEIGTQRVKLLEKYGMIEENKRK